MSKIENVERFIQSLKEIDKADPIKDDGLQIEGVAYDGIPYKKSGSDGLVLDATPFVGHYARLEFSAEDVLSVVKLRDVEINNESVPLVRAFIRKGSVGVAVRAFTVNAKSPLVRYDSDKASDPQKAWFWAELYIN